MTTPVPRPHAPTATVATAEASSSAPTASNAASPAAPTPPVFEDKRTKALRGRSFLNHQQRLGIIKKRDEEPTWSQVELARWAAAHFHLPKEPSQGTIAILLKKRDQLTAATVGPHTRTIRPPRHPELEAALLLWVRFLQSKRVPFTGENIRLKASFLAKQLNLDTNLNFSTGWMSGFVSRHDLVLARAHKKKHGDAEDEPLRSLLKKYEPRDVFAMDETALLYNDLPYGDDHSAKANPNRDRFCVGLAVNMDSSEKLEPLVVTTCRRKVGVLSTTYYNVDGNMTARIFEQWLYNVNQKMVSARRKIVLLVSTAPSHFPLKMSNIRLVLLPPKTGQRVHPMEAGITKSFKALYRRTHLSHAVDQAEAGQQRVFDVSIPRAMHWIIHAWHDVSVELVRNCWVRTGLAVAKDQPPTSEVVEIHPEVVQSLVVNLSQLQLLEIVPIETMLNAPIEQDAHYMYDDASVGRVVAGEGLPEEEHADQDEDMEGMTAELEKAKAGLKFATSASRTTTGGRSASAQQWNKAAPNDSDFHVVSEKEPTIDELLANYRGVIWSLDVAPDHSEDQAAALRFLRRKQAELRLLQQQDPRHFQTRFLRKPTTEKAVVPLSQPTLPQPQPQPQEREVPPVPMDTSASINAAAPATTASESAVEAVATSIVL